MAELPGKGLDFNEASQNDNSDPKRLSRFGVHGLKYGITTGASAASGFLLEAICVPSGAAFAAVNPLKDLSSETAISFLASSYIAWGAGIYANFKQTWRALEKEGVGTSAWAKVGYDLSGVIINRSLLNRFSRTSRVIQTGSTLTGFVALEVIKEAPYYAMAFGGKIALDNFAPATYSPNMEIAFLMGANLAAAVFNGAQALVVNRVLSIYQNRGRLRGG